MKSRLLALLLLVSLWAPVAAQDIGEGLYRLETRWGSSWVHLKRGAQNLYVNELGNTPEAADWKLVRVAGTPYFRIQNPNDPNGYLQVGAHSNAVVDVRRENQDPDTTAWQLIKRPNVPNGHTDGTPDAKNELHLLNASSHGIKSGSYNTSDVSSGVWRVTLADVAAQAARDRANRSQPPPGKWIVN